MVFKKITSPETVAQYVADKLCATLRQGKSVLWLVPGGSAIGIAVLVSRRLRDEDLSRLSIGLTDERFGPVGHADSNWLQLEQAGFEPGNAALYPVLAGKDMDETTDDFNAMLKRLLAKTDYKFGFFGIGTDGHTAGILPGSPAASSSELAASYSANYERITMTPRTIEQLDEAVVYAAGEAKWPILDQLETDMTIEEQPAQILKRVPRLTIFNDYKGETS